MDVTVLRARPDQVPQVLGVLDEAAGWLAGRGIAQWPDRFVAEWVAGQVAAGYTWLAWRGDAAVGTVTLDWGDPLWTDKTSAGYVHRLAVRRGAAGLGARLLGWAAERTRERGYDRLRLDCVTHNHGLRAYYEAAGFVARGDVTVGGAPGQRADDGPRTAVTRYELVWSDHRPLR